MSYYIFSVTLHRLTISFIVFPFYSNPPNSTITITVTITHIGMPGTGKTATVLATINELKAEAEQVPSLLPAFDFLEINCLRLQSPAQAYTVLWRGLSGIHASSDKALKLLKSHFEDAATINIQNNSLIHRNTLTETESESESEGRQQQQQQQQQRRVLVCLVDELDYLMTRDDQVVYNFFNWPMVKDSLLVVVGIANIMDLPERLTSRVASRFDNSMTRLVFTAYEYAQIQEILQGRLDELGLTFLNKSSMELIGRKAATVAGDLRAALKICQRTIELYRDQEEAERKFKLVLDEETLAAAAAEATIMNTIMTSMPYGTTLSHIDEQMHVLESEQKNDIHSNKYITTYEVGGTVGSLGKGTATAMPTPARNNQDVLPFKKKNIMALVKQAADEYKESPMMATVSRLCSLDRAIIIGACKHLRATEDAIISIDSLRMRLNDILTLAKKNNLELHVEQSTITIPCNPPQHIFEEAVRRLVEQGIFNEVRSKQVGTHAGANANAGGDKSLSANGYGPSRGRYSLRLEITDMVASLSDLYQHRHSYAYAYSSASASISESDASKKRSRCTDSVSIISSSSSKVSDPLLRFL